MPSIRQGITRRRWLTQAGALALTAIAAPVGPRWVQAQPRFHNFPFALGVASGEPLSDGFVLWTRLAPDPFDPEALDPEPILVEWVVTADERMSRIVRQGTVVARPELAHSAHVEVRGLEPNRPYWYRFRAGGEIGPIGRASTTPVYGAPLDRFRFAFASCQHYEQGFFVAYRHMLADDPDLIVHLGDYIYESSWGDAVRRHEGPEPTTLAEYRARHALYKLDPDLQAAHAACPWIVTWDDHEVDNDYAADQSETFDDPKAFLERRAAAYQAYYEHMPLRRSALPRGPEMRLYQRFTFGDLIQVSLLDNRQYRSDQACDDHGKGGGQLVENCAEIDDPNRTLLGEAQERWLLGGLERSPARWNVIAQQTLFAPFDSKAGPDEAVWTDGWSGYAPSRDRILAHLRDRAIANPVVIGGDVHAFWATALKANVRDEKAPVVATEFVTSSITSAGPPYERFAAALPENPHVTFMETRQRGYGLGRVTPDLWRTELRAINTVRDPTSPARPLASFVIATSVGIVC